MNEKDALKKFYECANNNDLAGCLESSLGHPRLRGLPAFGNGDDRAGAL